jgi:hypothetical protein
MAVPAGHSVFLRAKEGPFRCGNCEYWDGGWCHQRDMVKVGTDYGLQVLGSKTGPVRYGDCCDYFKKGRYARV